MPNLLRAADSSLVVIDVQERLAAVMPARDAVVRTTGILLEAAGRLDIPVFLTEQSPIALGPTVASLREKLPPTTARLEKTSFSACAALPLARPQVVLAGMEAHVCVLQTAFDLAACGREVFVAGDAVCSRADANRDNAFDRLRAAGVTITNTESILFEWLRDASHEQFRPLSKLIR